MLSRFAVVHEHSEPLDRVLVHCFDGAQTVLVFIPREAVDDYFRRRDLTPRQRNLLIDRRLGNLVPVISAKYERGEVNTYASPTGRVYPQIDLTLIDLEQIPEKLTDGVLDVADRAGFTDAQGQLVTAEKEATMAAVRDERISVRLSPAASEAVEDLMRLGGFKSPADAIRRAIADERFLLEKRTEGFSILLRKGKEHREVVWREE